MQLVATATKLCDHISRKKFRVAPRHIHIHVRHTDQAIEHRFKIDQQLHLIEQHIILSIICDPLLHILPELRWITIGLVFIRIKRHLDNVRRIHAFRKQMIFKNFEQQIRFPASAQSCDHLDQSVAAFCQQFIEILVTFNLHRASPYYIKLFHATLLCTTLYAISTVLVNTTHIQLHKTVPCHSFM